MKLFWIFFCLSLVCATSCALIERNPFDESWETPFGAPPFERIKTTHYLPAFKKGMALEKKEIAAIAGNSEIPTFANTVSALDYTGEYLTRVDNVFRNMTLANTDDALQDIAKTVSPLLSKHRDDIRLDDKLFARIKSVWNQRESLDLTSEQVRLLEETYKGFVRSGALLDAEKKERLRKINENLSLLSLKFGENVLKEDNRFELVIEDAADLAGLPDAVVSAAAEAAAARGHGGKWVFTLHQPSRIPFLQYAENRTLREKIFTAYIMRGDQEDELDNKEILSEMAVLRVEKARLLGYETHAHYVLEENMAKTPEQVYAFLDQLWAPALRRARAEAEAFQKLIIREGHDFRLMPWDWWYYAEKLKLIRYDLDEEMLRPYFVLENVRQGVFDLAGRLWGVTFEKREDIPRYHEEVEVFELKDRDGSHLGLFYTDYFPRAGKRGGAWMSSYRRQSRKNGEDIRPHVCNVGNFSRPTGEKPALLSPEEVETLFHEFGHALHGLFSKTEYPSLSGTNVARDFVELPSQIMENWAMEPAVLKSYALHYQTGEPIPDALIEKIRNASLFNQGFATTEYLAASYLDMDWHTLTEQEKLDPRTFELNSLERIGLIPEIVVRYRSPYFRHIFSGGYSSGYYSYIWAEVLDADAFQAFKEAGLFDRETAGKFRDHVLSAGNTDDPMVLYQRFRGAAPDIKPLLERRGLK